jgi:hypothetical protein
VEANCAVNILVEIVTYICAVEISTDYPSISQDQSKILKISQGEKKT